MLGAGAALMLALALAPDAHAASEPDAVSYRRHIMKTLGEQAAALGQVLQQNSPAENAALHARTIAITAKTAVKAFEPHVPGGEAKEDIWRRWDDFAARLNALSVNAETLAEIGERDGLPAMQAKVMDVLNCKSCHDAYKMRQGR